MFEGMGFARNPLLRHSAERDNGLVARCAADANALTALIAGDIPILRRNGAAVTGLLPLAAAGRAPAIREQAGRT